MELKLFEIWSFEDQMWKLEFWKLKSRKLNLKVGISRKIFGNGSPKN